MKNTKKELKDIIRELEAEREVLVIDNITFKESNDRYMRKLTDAELEVERLKEKVWSMHRASSNKIDELKYKLLFANKIIAKLIEQKQPLIKNNKKMKDEILDIVAEHCVGWRNCEALTKKLFDLYSFEIKKAGINPVD